MSIESIEQEFASSGIEVISNPALVEKLSLDYYHFSPILKEQLENKKADLVVKPKNEAQVLQVARLCVKHKIPLTIRGSGTGNYGQCIPLEGGIVLDTTNLNKIISLESGLARVEAGIKMIALDREAHKIGWELRMVPSTYHSATLGGFIGGGSVGAGSITYGLIKDPGNVLALRLVSMEDEPKVLELRGQDINKVMHAYGTNGIITELEVALAPAYAWLEVIVVFTDFMQAAKFGQAISDADGIVKKLVTILGDPVASNYFHALEPYLAKGCSCALLIIAPTAIEATEEIVKEHQGQISYRKSEPAKLLEFTWNHTTLLARSVDPGITYLQAFYYDLEKVEHLYRKFQPEVMMHLEFIRLNGRAIPTGIPLVRYSTAERLNQIIEYHQAHGVSIANPHTYIIEEGGTIEPEQLILKQKLDPYGLLNPGKMRAWSQKV